MNVTGRVHSIQTLGTLDGPGVRCLVFMQGCPLRCGCCHNPDTWDPHDGSEYSAHELAETALRYRPYFGKDGGVTLSGGEPLLQARFAAAFFTACREQGLHTCLDTSGCRLDEDCKALLAVTDRVLLDVKYTADDLYRRHVGCALQAPLTFLQYLNEHGIPVTLRQVVIPTLNDTVENIRALNALIRQHSCIDKVELLPFRKLCVEKYQRLGIPFSFEGIPEPTAETMTALEKEICI